MENCCKQCCPGGCARVRLSPVPAIAGSLLSVRRATVAGAGTGTVPWEPLIVPLPTAIGWITTPSTCSVCSAVHAPITSAIASSAPTSWKCAKKIPQSLQNRGQLRRPPGPSGMVVMPLRSAWNSIVL